jgi:hypothetical protein
LGLVSIAHLFPSQASTKVRLALAVSLLLYVPTAVHALAELHDTAERELSRDPFGLGVGSIVHVLPFQTSARVRLALP